MPDPSGWTGNSLSTSFKDPKQTQGILSSPSSSRTPAPSVTSSSTGTQGALSPSQNSSAPSSIPSPTSSSSLSSALRAGLDPVGVSRSQEQALAPPVQAPPQVSVGSNPFRDPNPFRTSDRQLQLVNQMNTPDRALIDATRQVQANVGGTQNLPTPGAIVGLSEAAKTAYGETGPKWGNPSTQAGIQNISAVNQVILNRLGLAKTRGDYGGTLHSVLKGFDANGYDQKRVKSAGIGPNGNSAFQQAQFGTPEYAASIQSIKDLAAGTGVKLPDGVKTATNYRAQSMGKPRWGSRDNPYGFQEIKYGPHLFSNPDPGRGPLVVADNSAAPMQPNGLPALPPPIPPPIQVAEGPQVPLPPPQGLPAPQELPTPQLPEEPLSDTILKTRVMPDGRLEQYEVPRYPQVPSGLGMPPVNTRLAVPSGLGTPPRDTRLAFPSGLGMEPRNTQMAFPSGLGMPQQDVQVADNTDTMEGYGDPNAVPPSPSGPKVPPAVQKVAEGSPTFFQRLMADLNKGKFKTSGYTSGGNAQLVSYLAPEVDPLSGLQGDAAIRTMFSLLAKGKNPFEVGDKNKTKKTLAPPSYL